MTRYLIALFTFLQLSAISQTTIFSDSGESYNGSNGVTTDAYPVIDISNCSSINISLDFEFSLPWEGDGNMEICTDCPVPCGCDIEFPTAGGCSPCWDFLYVQFSIDGNEIFSDLIGDVGTTDDDQFGSMDSGFICTDGASSADILVQTQTWAGNETVTFSNIVVVCYEAAPIDIEYTAECDGTDLVLTAQAEDNSEVTAWDWSTNGVGSFAPNNSQTTTYSNGSNGDEITIETEDPNGCTEEYSETLMYSDPPTASIVQTGDANLCIGDCTNINIDFSGGQEPYLIEMNFQVDPLLNVPITFPNFTSSDAITVCFDGSGFLFNVNDNTFTISDAAAGMQGNFSLISFSDADGCDGTVTGSGFTVNFLDSPQAFPAMMEMCEENFGEATFNLSEIESTINAGTGFDVNYWFDSGTSVTINSPFTTATTTIFATVDNGSCNSPAVPITLTVLPEGDVGQVLFSCSDSGSIDCSICDANGDGQEEVTLYFFFPNGGDNEVEVLVNNSITFTGNYSGQFAQENYTISGPTTFEIIRITPLGQCPDESDLGQVITISLGDAPDINPINDVMQCAPYQLPNITGTNLSGSEGYYTLSGGMGASIPEGTEVNSSTTLYIYDGSAACFDEEVFDIIIGGGSFDDMGILFDCDSVSLPILTGTDLSGGQAYYSEPNGNGILYVAGDFILESDTLFAYDINGNCVSQDSVFIMINDAPQAGIGDSLSYCNNNNLILNLPALLVEPADTAGIWSDNMGIIQENTDSTMVDMGSFQGEVIFQYIIQNENCGPDTSALVIMVEEQPFAGDDVNLVACNNESTYNLLNEFSNGSNPSEIGTFVSSSTALDVSDPTSIPMDMVTAGEYNISHIIPISSDSICLADTTIITLSVETFGVENNVVDPFICLGEMVDLDDYFTLNNASITFSDPNNTGALDANNVINSNLLPNIFPSTNPIEYTITSTNSCPGLMNGVLSLNVVTEAEAGDSTHTELCETGVYNLNQFLQGATQGGVFSTLPNGDELTSQDFDFQEGLYEFQYTLGNNLGCGTDSVRFTVNVIPQPEINVNIDEETICNGDKLEVHVEMPDNPGYTLSIRYYSTTMINMENVPDVHNILQTSSDNPTFNINLDGSFIILDHNPGDYVYFEIVGVETENCIYETSILDSIQVVALDTTIITGPICESDSIIVGSERFDINNRTGEVLFERDNACDSIVLIDLEFLENPVEDLLLTACSGDTISIGTLNLTEDNNSGVFTMYSGASNGCDSIINVEVEFSNSVPFNVDKLLCAGVSEEYNGVVYDINNPTGIDTIVGGSVSGCDSIINVNLDFYPPNIVNLNQELCNGQSIEVNGVTYDFNNPMGVETLVDQNGCDSTVNVSITFVEELGSIIDDEICQGQAITVNGNTYDANTPSGMETMTSVAGCDSVITIDLTIVETLSSNLDSTLCQNQSIVLNGTTYDAGNPSGTESLVSTAGCDSIVIVNLTFVDAITTNLDSSLCLNQSLIVNGNTYDSNNPSGTESFTSVAGCDSIVSINLTFTEAINTNLDPTLCLNQSIVVNGNTYDSNNPSGTESFTSVAGCDSIVNIDLNFVEAINTNLDSTLCLNQSLVVNGNTYDSNNPSGTESFTSVAGCDSIVNIDLNFVESFTTNIDTILCAKESLIINNTVYDINNLSGVESFTSVAGCDSTVNVNLTFEETTFDVSTNNPCPGEAGIISISNIQGVGPYTYTLNGTTMDIQGNEASISSTELSGEIILADANNCTYGVSYNITPANSFEIDYSLNGNVITITGITSDDISNIAWIPGEGLNCTDCLEVTTNSSEAIEYNVEITTMDGCIYSLTIPFAPEPVIEIPDYYTPNVFSPNNDGNNDVFNIVPGKFANKLIPSMRIFDRWGNLVFELNNFEAQPGIGWDGRYKGEYVNPGVYVFTFEVINNGQKEVRFGDVTVIR